MCKPLDLAINIGELASKGGAHHCVGDPKNLAGVSKFKAAFRIALRYD